MTKMSRRQKTERNRPRMKRRRTPVRHAKAGFEMSRKYDGKYRMLSIFLYSGLGAIAFSSMAVLLFTNYASHIGENYILSVITFTGLFFIMPAIMSWVAVIRRIGNGYYAKSMERTNLFNWNPTSYLGLAVGVVAVTRILTDAMDEDLKGILSLLFLATMAWIFSYNGTEHMLRHYFISTKCQPRKKYYEYP